MDASLSLNSGEMQALNNALEALATVIIWAVVYVCSASNDDAMRIDAM